MKKTNLYEIRDVALKSGRAVYSVQQLAHLIKKPKSTAKVYSSRLVRKGLAKRIIRGKISFVVDDYVISTQLLEPSYISVHSALLFHDLIMQVPQNVECVTTKNSIRYKPLGIVYHKIPGSLFFGYEKYGKGDSYVFVAEPEKAVIDGVYLNMLSKEDILEVITKLDKNKISKYIERFRGKGKRKLEEWFLK
jgi:predicted transcriptional regulator of viral defense system